MFKYSMSRTKNSQLSKQCNYLSGNVFRVARLQQKEKKIIAYNHIFVLCLQIEMGLVVS